MYVFDVRLDFFFRPVPPPEFQKSGYGFVREAPADWFCRNAADDGIGRHILCHDGTGADDRAVPDGDTGKNDGFVSDPYVIADDDIAFIVPGIRYILNIQIPFFKKMGKG